MPRTLLALLVAAAAAGVAAPAHASTVCSPLGPVPGRQPVCSVKCVIGAAATVAPQLEPYSEPWPFCQWQD